MKTVFISYCHIHPDLEVAQNLTNYLRHRDVSVFIDIDLSVGIEWAREIELQIKSATFFVVLLSKESIRSDLIRQEVKLAHDVIKSGKEFTILPVRLNFSGELPYDLGAYLNQFQYLLWNDAESFEAVGSPIYAAIENSVELPVSRKNDDNSVLAGVRELAKVTDDIGAPLPSADQRLALETGSVKLSSPFYIRRKADIQLERYIRGNGTTSVIKGTRQMGKSSLLARAKNLAQRYGQKALYLDFQLIDERHLESLESLARYLMRKLDKCLPRSASPEHRWDRSLGAKENLTQHIEDTILPEFESSILLLFDEVDLMFGVPYRDQFFGIIRGWHNLRATDEIWNRLNLAIAHSTEPYLWIQNLNQSPFNVGFQITLDDFVFSEVNELNQKYGELLRREEDIRELMTLVGGHPYLIRQALFTLNEEAITLEQLHKMAAEERGPFGDHLRRYVWLIQNDPGLKDELQSVLRSSRCKSERYFQILRAAGLVNGDNRHSVHLRCQLYEMYFLNHL